MAKSTASSSVYSRMATQAPGLKTSGARPLMALGEVSPDMFVLPARFVFPAGRCLGGLPGVAAIEIHPHIAARACRSAEADLIPGRRMRVIGGGNVMQQPLPEEDCRRHALPGVRRDLPVLDFAEQPMLLVMAQVAERFFAGVHGLGVNRRKPQSPGLVLLRQADVAIAVAFAAMELLIDHR